MKSSVVCVCMRVCVCVQDDYEKLCGVCVYACVCV